MKSELFKRIISSVVLIPLTLLCFYLGGLFFTFLLFLGVFIVFKEWVEMSKKIPGQALFLSFLGAFYFLACGAGLWALRFNDEYGLVISSVFIISIWVSDIFAFVCGKLIGGPKIVPWISPHKTWAGFIGAFVFPVLFLILVQYLGFWEISGIEATIMGCVIGISAQCGDFLISMMKRYVGVKDTGTIIPGHGGLLDRVDSLIFATPVFYLCVEALL